MDYATLKAKCRICALSGSTPYTERWHVVAKEGDSLTDDELAFVAGAGVMPTHYVKEGNIIIIQLEG